MNIIKFELHAILKTLLVYIAVLIFTIYSFVAGIYPMFEDEANAFSDLIANMSPEYLLAFGFDVENMFGYNGFYSFSYIYFTLIMAIMATSMAIAVFGREKKCHCGEFLFTKPVSRSKIFFSKFAVVLCAVVVCNFVVAPVSLFCFSHYGELNKEAILVTLGLTFTQLIFVGIGTTIAVFIPKIRISSSITAAVGLLTFIVCVLVNTLKIEWLEYLSPLHFFSPNYIFDNGKFDTFLMTYGAVIFFACLLISAIRYLKFDLKE